MIAIQNIKYCYVLFSSWALILVVTLKNIQPTGNQSVEVEEVLTIGGTKNESAQPVVNTPDGGYAVLGYTQSMDGDISNKTDTSFDYWLLKFDASGQQQGGKKAYGGSDDDRGEDLITTNDGGYAILGSSKSNDGDVSNNSEAMIFGETRRIRNNYLGKNHLVM